MPGNTSKYVILLSNKLLSQSCDDVMNMPNSLASGSLPTQMLLVKLKLSG